MFTHIHIVYTLFPFKHADTRVPEETLFNVRVAVSGYHMTTPRSAIEPFIFNRLEYIIILHAWYNNYRVSPR